MRATAAVHVEQDRDGQRAMVRVGSQLFSLASALTVVMNSAAHLRSVSSVYVEMAELFESAATIHRLGTSVLAAEPVDWRDAPRWDEPVGTPVGQTYPYAEMFLLWLLARQWSLLGISPSHRLAQCAWLMTTASLLRQIQAGQDIDLDQLRRLRAVTDRLQSCARSTAATGRVESFLPPR